MITTECRPKTFDQMAGQDLAKVLLRNIVRDPESAPKTLIFYGGWGTGKTSSARIFARSLNCERHGVNPCMKCDNCLADIEQTAFYREYDSSIIGKADRIRELRDTFYSTGGSSWQVITFDEVHLISNVAQGALLKILEDAPPRTFFILATTDPNKLLPTIRSRALEVKFDRVSDEALIENISKICEDKGIVASRATLELVAKKSRGHMRDAHKYLDQISLIGEESFREVSKSCRDEFLNYFEAIARGSKERLFESISQIMQYPLAEARDDYHEVVFSLAKQMVGVEQGERVKSIVSLFGQNILKLVKMGVSDWVLEGFSADVVLQTTLLCVFQIMTQSAAPRKREQSIYDRGPKR